MEVGVVCYLFWKSRGPGRVSPGRFLVVMSWPLQSDFASMLKNPHVGFRDPELQRCTVEMNSWGQPRARSGNFASVYRGFRPDGCEFAIRVFHRRQDERLEHYRRVSQYLQGRAISSIVGFRFDPRGIRSARDGKLYPLLLMDWVPGVTLFDWIQSRCREGYARALHMAAGVWLHVVGELAHQGVVHGDLQHGNVLVSREGHFKLVDYDCMGVPSLLGRRNLETGLPPYQHPGRNQETPLFSGLDNFSALVIYVALRALAASPGLWCRYVDQTGYDRILFREGDFLQPAASPLYRELQRLPDRQVVFLAGTLFELAQQELGDVPPLSDVLRRCEVPRRVVAPADPWRSGPANSARKRHGMPALGSPVPAGSPALSGPPRHCAASPPQLRPPSHQCRKPAGTPPVRSKPPPQQGLWWAVGFATVPLLVLFLGALVLLMGRLVRMLVPPG